MSLSRGNKAGKDMDVLTGSSTGNKYWGE